jgi:PPOX class probable F420-dependent enzyme
MDADDARRFVSENHRAVLVTHKAGGGLQISPVTVGADEEGKVVISSRETAYKVKNLKRKPQATICALNDRFYGQWIRIDGTAEVISLPEAMDGLVDYYRRVAGEHPDWDEYRAAMEKERRVLVRITLERAGPDRSG